MVRSLLLSLVLLTALPMVATEKSADQQMKDLFALIDQADEMVVYSEGLKRESEVYRSGERKDFEELKVAISLSPSGGPFACACIDGPEIALLKNKKEIAAVWNHEGTAIGSSVWEGDWDNRDPDRWLHWFDARGMTYAREFFDQMRAQERKHEKDEKRWLSAMPASLQPMWADAHKQFDPPLKYADLKALNAALEKQYPDTYERILGLMGWFGSGAGPWSGYPGYEQIAEKLLRQYPTAELIRAAESGNLTDQELEGAARILAEWTPVPDKTPIPAALRRTLLEHCLKSSDEDKVARAHKAFAADK
jgi:hypothetical protein